ncbi:hypothetical protein SAMN05216548_10732 [Faunimonas pinastri]|uniref:Uncharacterized protein n=1 Tax=Faunimonas pinastri TaxID=1855383 RepID=A0A1H9IA51_9HYPH|nr:hypothetical protein [Faunimonas pinastri]SEQ71398.1 hypothetical protein SAMN05216548_10732 [Faunimonas pinastri]
MALVDLPAGAEPLRYPASSMPFSAARSPRLAELKETTALALREALSGIVIAALMITLVAWSGVLSPSLHSLF